MNTKSSLRDVDPEIDVVGLGAPIRRQTCQELIGPDTEGLKPGFHKQSNGMLMYVPNMADPIYNEPEGDDPEDAGRPEDLYWRNLCPGFYSVNSEGCGTDEYVKHWDGVRWSDGHMEPMASLHTLSRMHDQVKHTCVPPVRVVRARPDLTAMVRK